MFSVNLSTELQPTIEAKTIMARIIQKTVYQFDELTDSAKAKARDWYRSSDDGYYLDNVVDDFSAICEILGLSLDTHSVQLMSGKSRQAVDVFYSVAYCQGDYAAFAGTWKYKKGCKAELSEYEPNDKELASIVDDWCAVNRRHFYRLCARCSVNRDFQRVDEVYVNGEYRDEPANRETESEVDGIVRRLADWLYSRLRDEVDFQNSDENVDESITANEYEFDDSGSIAA